MVVLVISFETSSVDDSAIISFSSSISFIRDEAVVVVKDEGALLVFASFSFPSVGCVG